MRKANFDGEFSKKNMTSSQMKKSCLNNFINHVGASPDLQAGFEGSVNRIYIPLQLSQFVQKSF